MGLLLDCNFSQISAQTIFTKFNCGNHDLNEFLQNDALPFLEARLGNTYIFTLNERPDSIVCFFTISNDAMKLSRDDNKAKRKVNKKIPHTKQMLSYPSVKIGRLGVNQLFRGAGLGTELMDFIKAWFYKDNKAACRFLLVDAYNEEEVLKYYLKNDFDYLLTEETESKKDKDGNPIPLKTRLMFYDLMQLRE